MVKGVEGSREVKKNKSRDVLPVTGEGNVVVDAEECCFSGMVGAVCRLEGSDGREGVEMGGEAGFDDAVLQPSPLPQLACCVLLYQMPFDSPRSTDILFFHVISFFPDSALPCSSVLPFQ